MEELPINLVDLAIALILLISAALAFLRGVVRELFFIAALVAATAATYYGFARAQPLARELIGVPLIGDAAAGAAIFAVTLVFVVLIGGVFSRAVRSVGLGALDRSFGLLFGLARGALIVCIAYILVIWVLPPEERPDAMREARAMPLVAYGAELVLLAIPFGARAEWASAAGGTAAPALDAREAFQKLISPPPYVEQKGAPGYTSAQRKALERLIESTN